MEAQANKNKKKKIKGIDIFCCECEKHLGKIREGSLLLPKIVYACPKCRDKWEKLKTVANLQDNLLKNKRKPGENIFDDLFGTGNPFDPRKK